jgi:hypothetical protein
MTFATAQQRIRSYVRHHFQTIAVYDLGRGYPPSPPNAVTATDIQRTRKIGSRIPMTSTTTWVAVGQTATWNLALTAQLGELNGQARAVHLAHAHALYYGFYRARSGMARSVVSKVLHLKRPHFFPILDARVALAYSALATPVVRTQHIDQTPAMWQCVTNDLLNTTNRVVLAHLRTWLSTTGQAPAALRDCALLSDVRLLDILTW